MDNPALERLDSAIQRLERAVAGHRDRNADLARRHATLKTRMCEAVAALDRVIAHEGASEGAQAGGEA